MIYWFVRYLSACILKLFYSLKIYGRENIPKEGPYLICSNHCSFLDPLVICAALTKRVYWVALKDLYRIWPLAPFLKAIKCIPVNGAIKEVLEALRQGKVVGMFPEGRRTYTGRLMSKGRKGAALAAMRSGVRVLPIWISGTHQAYPRRAKLPKIHPIQAIFGEPIVFEIHNEKIIDEAVLSIATGRIMDSISKLQEKLQNIMELQ